MNDFTHTGPVRVPETVSPQNLQLPVPADQAGALSDEFDMLCAVAFKTQKELREFQHQHLSFIRKVSERTLTSNL